MPLKKTKRKKRKTKKAGRQPSRFERIVQKLRSMPVMAVLAVLLVFGTLLTALYCVYLDMHIRAKFEGKRWALPARVYARPLEIYAGSQLSQEELIKELAFLNYRSGRDSPGTYQQIGNAVILHTRGFTFWDDTEPGRKLTVTFSGERISEILDINTGLEVQLLRLEPAQIANIYPAHKEDRDLIRIEQAPDFLVAALLAVEDRDFYEHAGVKPTAIIRAMLANIRAGQAVQGGSTLTQQLIKNFFLSNERSIRRKAVEAIMALLLEVHYDKEEILEAYLNEVYLGQQGERAIHGFALASRFYFDRPLGELATEQLALLVGLVKGPSYYNPWRHPERARQRRDLVIDVMQSENLLNDEEARLARLAPLDIRSRGVFTASSYPAFIDLIKMQLQTDYRDEDLRSEGLRIFTTLDPLVQQAAEDALSGLLGRLESNRGIAGQSLQGAVLVTSTDTGEVLAVVGDRDPKYNGFNRVLSARRPVGSLVKPAVYLSALDNAELYNASTILEDTPLRLEYPDGRVWEPQNYDSEFHGQIPLFHGFIYSYNVVTARLGLQLGVEQVITTLKKMGMQETPPAYPSLLLGALELSPWQVAGLYQTMAADGFRMPLRAVRDVLTSDADRLTRYSLQIKQTLDPASVYMINRLMQEVAEVGTAKAIGRQLPELQAAGKTGTSDDLRDSWFAGFTGQHLAVVWVGRDDNQPMGLAGSTGALPVWLDLMSNIRTRPLQMNKPANIEDMVIDLETGKRSSIKCDNIIRLPFIIGTAPKARVKCGRKSLLDWFLN